MPGRRRSRHRNAEEKRSICRETRAPDVSVAQVARRHALNANLIFKWLKDRRLALTDAVEAAPVFLPVEIHGAEVPAARITMDAHEEVAQAMAAMCSTATAPRCSTAAGG